MAKRRTKEQVQRERSTTWESIRRGVINGYSSFRKCKGCGEMKNCAGRTYENQRCKDCFK